MNVESANPPLRILLVENHDDTRKYLAMYLEGGGHRVTMAQTFREGLAAAAKGDHTVLITDIGLPDGDGWRLLREARFLKPVYAIAISGYGLKNDVAKSREAGFRCHLLKPLRMKELERALQEASAELKS